MSYTTLYKRPSNSSPEPSLDIYLYANRPEHDDLVTKYGSHLKNSLDQLVDQDAIASYHVRYSDQNPQISAYGGIEDMMNKFISYDGPNNKNSTPGSHGLVCDLNGGLGELYDTPYDGEPDANNQYFGWEVSANWVVGSSQGDVWHRVNYYLNSMIHEIAHNCVNMQNPDVRQYAGDDGNNESTEVDTAEMDHSLGTRIDNKSSPMGNGYPKARGWGPCHSTKDVDGFTSTLSNCTVNAFEISAEDSLN